MCIGRCIVDSTVILVCCFPPVTMAKGIANGFPMGAVVTTPGIYSVSFSTCAHVCVSLCSEGLPRQAPDSCHMARSCRDRSNNDTSSSHEYLWRESSFLHCCISCAGCECVCCVCVCSVVCVSACYSCYPQACAPSSPVSLSVR